MIYNLGLTNIVAKFDEKTEAHTVSNKSFIALVKGAIRSIPFDEDWYLSQYEDVQNAVADKLYETAFQHYLEHGFMECRLPYKIVVDEEFYLNTYKDVRASVDDNTMPSAQWHFENHGRCEGRSPYRDFSLLREAIPKSAAAVREAFVEEPAEDRDRVAEDHAAALLLLPPRRRRRKRSSETGRSESKTSSTENAQRLDSDPADGGRSPRDSQGLSTVPARYAPIRIGS